MPDFPGPTQTINVQVLRTRTGGKQKETVETGLKGVPGEKEIRGAQQEEEEGDESVVKPPEGKWKTSLQLKVALKRFWMQTGSSQRDVCHSVCLIISVYTKGNGKVATRHCMAQRVLRANNNSAAGLQIFHLGF